MVFYIPPYSLIINIKQLYSFWRITQFVDTNYSVLSLELLNSSLRITQFFLSNYSILLCKDTKNRWVPHCSWYFFSILNSSYIHECFTPSLRPFLMPFLQFYPPKGCYFQSLPAAKIYIYWLVEIVNKLNCQVWKSFATKATETQGSLVLLVPVALSYFFN